MTDAKLQVERCRWSDLGSRKKIAESIDTDSADSIILLPRPEKDAQILLMPSTEIILTDNVPGLGAEADIVTRLKNEIGDEIDRHKIHLEHPIKTTGEHEVAIKLHHDVTVNFKFEVKSAHEEQAKAVEPAESAESAPKRGLFRRRK